jgi:peptidoglycan/xylan/chitin deacetylase (PgdA/CDA1 family)
MRIRGLGRLRLVAGKLQNRLSPGTLILLYHRIADLSVDPQSLSVTPAHFDEHLQVLSRTTKPLSLSSLVQSLKSSQVTKHGTVITFDDGAADNLHNAKPILERYHLPATVFVATEYSKGEREFWWDELERLVLIPGELPEKLSLKINGTNLNWNLEPLDAASARQTLYQQLGDFLRPMSAAQRFEVIGELQQWSGGGTKPRQTHRALSPQEIRQLADGGLVEIGAHTVTHPVLSALPITQQEQEIRQSKTQLEEILNQPIKSFAYPYGTKDDYTHETVELVRQAKYTCACSNYMGVTQPKTPRYELPRFVVRDWDGDEFERRLRGWFRG